MCLAFILQSSISLHLVLCLWLPMVFDQRVARGTDLATITGPPSKGKNVYCIDIECNVDAKVHPTQMHWAMWSFSLRHRHPIVIVNGQQSECLFCCMVS